MTDAMTRPQTEVGVALIERIRSGIIDGVTIVKVPSREEALKWAAKVAAACRCAQEVWEFPPDPEITAMLRQADSYRRPR